MKNLYRSIILFLSCLMGAITAFASDPFIVANVLVDATAETAIKAQELAMIDGQARAAAILLTRVTVPSEVAAKGVPTPTPEMVGRMISSLGMEDAQNTADRFFGDMTIAFNPTQVRRFLNANGLTMFSSQAQNRLAVPMGDTPELQSAISKALTKGGFENSLTPLKIAQGGYFDPSLATGNINAAKSLASSYGLQHVTVFKARETYDGVAIDMIDMGLLSGAARNFATVTGPTASLALANAVAALETNWKEQSASFAATAQDLPVSVLFNSHNDWRLLQEAIDDSAQIQSAQLTALSKDGALMTLSYGGDLAKLSQELSYKGVTVKQDPQAGVIIGRSNYLR